MDRGACQATVHWVAKSWTRLKLLSACAYTHTCMHTGRAWALYPITGVLLRRGEDSRGGHVEMEAGVEGTIYKPGDAEDCQWSGGAGSEEPSQGTKEPTSW